MRRLGKHSDVILDSKVIADSQFVTSSTALNPPKTDPGYELPRSSALTPIYSICLEEKYI